MSVFVVCGESHDYESSRGQTIENPNSKIEKLNQVADFARNDEDQGKDRLGKRSGQKSEKNKTVKSLL